jgi:parvulin-like peptidyl-prolyl isomerase
MWCRDTRKMDGVDHRSNAACGARLRDLVAVAVGAAMVFFIANPASLAESSAERTSTPATSAGKSQRLTVMAVVNGKKITRQQLADECARRYGTDVLESIVNKHLIWRACQAKNIQITDQDVDAEIVHLAKKFGLSPDRWLLLLEQERDLSPEQYRREIVWPTLALRALASSELVVTAEELRQGYEAEYGPRVKARAITVSSRSEAERIRALAVAKPDDFGRLAKEHSEDQSASVHGLIPPIRKNMGDENLERVAFSLKAGEVSPVIQVANQFVILKCEKRLAETYVAPRFRQDAEQRVRDRLQEQKLRTVSAGIFQRLQEEAKVVNVLNDPDLRKKHPGVAALIDRQPISIQQLAEECLARYGHEVLEGEINRQILIQALDANGQEVTEADIDKEIARAADAYGFLKSDGSPDIDAWLSEVTKAEGATVELYVRDAVWPTVALKKLVTENVEVTDEDIRRGFESNYGPRVEALAIVLTDQRQAQKVWEMARNNPTDQFFGELAHQYSTDAVSRENFGKVPPIRRYGGRPQMEDEAFSLKPGELSGIIVSGENFVILRCLGRTTPVVATLDAETRGELVKDLREKKLRIAMNVEFDRLCGNAHIDNYLAGTFQAAGGQSASPAPVVTPRTAGQQEPGRRTTSARR